MTDAESTSDDAPEAASEAPPGPARLLPPSGAAAEPPIPSVVGRLPASIGGGASYVDTRRPSYVFLAVVATLSVLVRHGSHRGHGLAQLLLGDVGGSQHFDRRHAYTIPCGRE